MPGALGKRWHRQCPSFARLLLPPWLTSQKYMQRLPRATCYFGSLVYQNSSDYFHQCWPIWFQGQITDSSKSAAFAEGLYRRRGLRDHLHPFDSIGCKWHLRSRFWGTSKLEFLKSAIEYDQSPSLLASHRPVTRDWSNHVIWVEDVMICASPYVRPIVSNISCSLRATQGTWDDHLPLFKKEIIS